MDPPSAETHSAQPRLALPTATSVGPAAAIADTSTGRPLPPLKSAAADRAGGNPAASADGAALPPPLFAPRTTTPATPTAIAATSGAARLVSQLRARIAARVSLASRAGRPGPAGGSSSVSPSHASCGGSGHGSGHGWAGRCCCQAPFAGGGGCGHG